MHHFTVSPEEADSRLDSYVAGKLPELSRTMVSRLIEGNEITLNGATIKPGIRVKAGDSVSVNIPPPRPMDILPEEIPLDILYEDEDLLVINKANGMVTHPAPGSREHTLVNAILAHCGNELSGIGGVERPGIVHRLDKDTTGLLVVAKNDLAHQSLSSQIASREAQRRYLALIWGNPSFERARVEAPIRRHPGDRQRFMVAREAHDATAREAVTELEVKERFGEISLLEARLQTGRTHQIRVHCQYIGHPVLGDPVYGRRTPARMNPPRLREMIESLNGQALHAYFLSFKHPRTGKTVEFTTEPPAEMQELLKMLRKL